MAAHLSVRTAASSPERHDALDAVGIRQLAKQPPQSGASAKTVTMGPALVGRNGRSVDSGTDAKRADLVTLTREFRAKAAAEDVNGYEAEIERHSHDTGLHDDVALLYLEIGRPDSAVAHFQKSLELKGSSAPAHYNLGTALSATGRPV